MSFQFPANPADGDIVVRGNLLATYKEETNTWTVGEIPTYPGVPGPVGPQGIQGIQGNPGSGVNVTAIVDTFDDLPLDPDTGSFIVVADTNTLYYWDGFKYYDLGSPIQGPQGIQGETGDTGHLVLMVLTVEAGLVLRLTVITVSIRLSFNLMMDLSLQLTTLRVVVGNLSMPQLMFLV